MIALKPTRAIRIALLSSVSIALLSASLATSSVVADSLIADGPVPPKKPEKVEKAETPEKVDECDKKPEKKPEKKPDPFAWRKLFDGKTLKGWRVPKFGGDGEVKVKDGTIVLGMGDPMTGITYAGKMPTNNYELMLEGMRTEGIDFFATTTFPVGKEFCSFVTGGWAGTVVGISCVDYYDASDNITSQFKMFKDKEWYRFRIRVSDKRIECWVDDEEFVNLEREGHKFDIRDEVDLCRPFGISSYCTEGVLRDIQIRLLKPEEIAKIGKEEK